ncbi:MAG: hypothetical protein RJA63_1830 [Pseudomonadota bacterium]
MDDDGVWDELQDIENDLRSQAAELKKTADDMRDAARVHDGRAMGMLAAADKLAGIERPQ